MDAEIGFFTGVLFFGAGVACIGINVDSDFDTVQARLGKMERLCGQLGSKPKSFDEIELTCENGLVINYKEGNND